MKSVFCVVFLFTLFATQSFAATAYGQFSDPANPGKCTIQADLVLSPGEEIKDPNEPCARIICRNDGFASFQTCGATGAMEGCVEGDFKNPDLPYPDCCEREVKCD